MEMCRLIYSDPSLRSSLIFSLLPESYTDVLGAMLGSILHPSSPVCAALATLATPVSANLPKHHEHMHEHMQAGKRGDSLLEAPCGTGERGWYVGMHVRQSGLWDPSGSSPAGLFALRSVGMCPILHPHLDRHPLLPFLSSCDGGVCVCVRARARACVRARVCVFVCWCVGVFVCVEILKTVWNGGRKAWREHLGCSTTCST
jgi:hypothetical protein